MESQIQELVEAYRKFRSRDLRAELLKFRLDYVLYDKEGKIPFDESRFPFLKKAYEDERFIVYEI